MNKSKKSIILIFVVMIMVITALGFCKGRNQEKITKEKKIERAEKRKKTKSRNITRGNNMKIYFLNMMRI